MIESSIITQVVGRVLDVFQTWIPDSTSRESFKGTLEETARDWKPREQSTEAELTAYLQRVSRERLGISRADLLARTAHLLKEQRPSYRLMQSFSPFFEVARNRAYYQRHPSALRDLRAKVELLCIHDPESANFLRPFAVAVTDPHSEEMRYLLQVIHNTEERVNSQHWPAQVTREGPAAAFYYYFGGDAAKVKRFGKDILNPRTITIAFHSDGNYTPRLRPMRSPFDPLPSLFESSRNYFSWSAEDQVLLYALISFLKKYQLSFTRQHLQGLADDLRAIATKDPHTFSEVLKYFGQRRKDSENDWIKADWKGLRKSLESTARFITTFHGDIGWEGDVFAYYRLHHGNKNSLTVFRNRVVYSIEHSLRRRLVFQGAENPIFLEE